MNTIMMKYAAFAAVMAGGVVAAGAASQNVWQGALEPVDIPSEDHPWLVPPAWNVAGNWSLGVVPDSLDAVAYFTNKTLVTNSEPIDVGTLNGSSEYQPVWYCSDEPISFHAVGTVEGKNAIVNGYLSVFAPLVYAGASGYMWLRDVDICGEFSATTSPRVLAHSGYINFRDDRFATSPGSKRAMKEDLTIQIYRSGSVHFYAPRGGDYEWGFSSREGSVYMTTAEGSSAENVPVGATVSAPGVPQGAFVKRVFSSRWIEISAPATGTYTDEMTTFSAGEVECSHRLIALGDNASIDNKDMEITINKYHEDDIYEIDVGKLRLYPVTIKNNEVRQRTILDTKTGYFPGRLVVHNVSKADDTENDLRIGSCDILFGPPTDAAYAAGMPKTRVEQISSTAEARLSVTGGMSATILRISKCKGVIEKAGTGRLMIGMESGEGDAYSGTLRVSGGMLELVPGLSATPVFSGKIEIAAGATLLPRLETFGVGDLDLAEGAGIRLPVADDGSVTPVSVGKELSLPSDFRLIMESTAPLAAGAYPVITAGSLTGDPSGWTVEVKKARSHSYAVKKNGNTVVLEVMAHGTVMVVR